jgi:hypothetical protein
VLLRWEARASGRVVEVVRETDDELHVDMTCLKSDSSAAEDLDRLCVELGVRRRLLEQ